MNDVRLDLFVFGVHRSVASLGNLGDKEAAAIYNVLAFGFATEDAVRVFPLVFLPRHFL